MLEVTASHQIWTPLSPWIATPSCGPSSRRRKTNRRVGEIDHDRRRYRGDDAEKHGVVEDLP